MLVSLRVPDDHKAEPDQERFTTAADHAVDAAISRLDELLRRYSGVTAEMLLRVLVQHEFCGRLAVVSSFGAESAVLLALIAEIDRGVPILFLDTGKLFGETLRYRDRLIAALGLREVRTVHPMNEFLATGDADGMLWLNNPDRCCTLRKVVPLAARLKEKHRLEFLSIGGGLGIVYQPALASGADGWWKSGDAKDILTPQKYASRLLPLLQPLGLRVLMEPGRFISGNAGILVTRIEYVKRTGRKNFLIVDAAMNDLIRPTLYEAYHEIVPLTRKGGKLIPSDVVGPVCESGDYFAKDRPLPRLGEGDYLALLSAGAYGYAMASNYNTRPFAAEVLVNGAKSALTRTRQTIPSIWAGEKPAPWQK